jgi:hypothetical protein
LRAGNVAVAAAATDCPRHTQAEGRMVDAATASAVLIRCTDGRCLPP